MGRTSLKAVGWVLVGMAIMGIAVWFTMPSLMLIRHKTGLGYEATVAALNRAFEEKGDWRVLTVNDYRKSTAGFGSIEPTASLSICNPRYASRILANDVDRGVTAFMPLAVGVYEDKEGQVYISQLNVGVMGMMFGGTIAEVMGDAGRDLEDVIASVAAQETGAGRSNQER